MRFLRSPRAAACFDGAEAELGPDLGGGEGEDGIEEGGEDADGFGGGVEDLLHLLFSTLCALVELPGLLADII